MDEKIDVGRCLLAMKDVVVEGRASAKGERGKVISDAIAAIQADGGVALMGTYLGVKNYAAFGDQREDHQYGMGPRHGTIVFSVRRQRVCHDGGSEPILGADHVYLLECVRDCLGLDEPDPQYSQCSRHHNLCDILKEWEKVLKRLNELDALLAAAAVEAHAS